MVWYGSGNKTFYRHRIGPNLNRLFHATNTRDFLSTATPGRTTTSKRTKNQHLIIRFTTAIVCQSLFSWFVFSVLIAVFNSVSLAVLAPRGDDNDERQSTNLLTNPLCSYCGFCFVVFRFIWSTIE